MLIQFASVKAALSALTTEIALRDNAKTVCRTRLLWSALTLFTPFALLDSPGGFRRSSLQRWIGRIVPV